MVRKVHSVGENWSLPFCMNTGMLQVRTPGQSHGVSKKKELDNRARSPHSSLDGVHQMKQEIMSLYNKKAGRHRVSTRVCSFKTAVFKMTSSILDLYDVS